MFYSVKIICDWTPVLQQGSTVFITGFFTRINRDEFEFKVNGVSLAESMKKTMTKQVNIEAHPKDLTTEMLQFLEKNFRAFPGSVTLRFTLSEPRNKMRISLVGMSGGALEMNEETDPVPGTEARTGGAGSGASDAYTPAIPSALSAKFCTNLCHPFRLNRLKFVSLIYQRL